MAYVPAPAPLPELKAPPPPVVVRKGGVPLTLVALIAAGVLLVGGVTIALLWKSAPPMSAQARSAADGTDLLHLTCDPKGCPDGTTAALGASKATFAGGQADLPVATPLHLGDNDLALQVERPGIGRDETMKFVVAVAYRVRADVSTMSGPKPAITVRVEARPGTDVKVDGKPVALDANGAGAYAVDESAAALGPADESRVVSLDLPYAITPPAASKVPPENGTVSARVAISPLRVDAPGPVAVVEDDHVLIAGRGPKGASVTIDGNVVAVAADGSFETTVPLPATGDHVTEVRGGTQALMPRTVQLRVSRVASLADAAKAFEQSQHPIGYDDAMGDIAGKTGQPIVVEGPVLESRASGHRTLVLVDDRRGCKKGPCRARVVVGRDLALVPGDVLHAYGVVARGFTTPAGQTVPEVDSQFALRTKR
jgi:RNase P/RNase MRP subunit p29